MSEVVQGTGESMAPQREAPQEAGALLQAAREAAGQRIEVLAATLKVPVAKLTALEAGDLSDLQDRVFVRALVASICRQLKVPPEPILAKLPGRMPTAQLAAPVDGGGARAPVRLQPGQQFSGAHHRRLQPLMWAVLVLLVGVALMLFWPQLHIAEVPWTEPATKIPAGSNTQEPAQPAQPALIIEPSAQPRLAATAVTAQTAPAETGSGVGSASGPVVQQGAPLLELQAKAEAWVRVQDAKNKVLLQKTLAPGESVRFDSTELAPLAVSIGRADAVDVQVRGKRLEKPVSSNKVLRFTVP